MVGPWFSQKFSGRKNRNKTGGNGVTFGLFWGIRLSSSFQLTASGFKTNKKRRHLSESKQQKRASKTATKTKLPQIYTKPWLEGQVRIVFLFGAATKTLSNDTASG